MPLDELRKAVEGHAGIFHCRGRGDPSRVKDVAFHHEFGEPPATGVDLPLRSLADFYGTFAWLRLYRDPDSDDSAFYIGTPEEWAEFDEALRCWFEDLTPGERSGLLPPWIDDCLVIGEIPRSGNYLLVPLSGPRKGHVVEFDHDGFSFNDLGDDVEQFVWRALSPDSASLGAMAAFLTFPGPGDPWRQWQVEVMEDNRGNCVRTRD